MSGSVPLDLAFRLADLAGSVTAPHVRGPSTSADPGTGDMPPGTVDRAVEERLLAEILDGTDHGFLGEEVGLAGAGEPWWVVDGIDGTVAFRAGRPEWATLIALMDGRRVVLGVASAPALRRRRWASRGSGAWTGPSDGEGTTRRLAVATDPVAGAARVAMWPPPGAVAPEHRPRAEALDRAFACHRPLPWAPSGARVRPSWGSGVPGGALLVASGMLDAFVLFGGGAWDHAAPAVIVEEAGGRFSDDAGLARLDRGVGVFSNGRVHDEVLAALP